MTSTAEQRPAPLSTDPFVEHPVIVRLTLTGDLGSRVRRGLSVTAAAQALMIVVQLGGQALLARLLLPEDYGLVALGAVVVTLAAFATDLGLTTAVVQAREVTERLLSTAFWFNALVGVAATALVVALAPLVAGFYGDERVTPLLQLAALAFALNLASVPFALLQRTMRFRLLSALELVTAVWGLAATAGLALAGAGVYALVLGPLSQVVVFDVLVLAAVRWRPRHFVSRPELRRLWRFGRGVTGANLLNVAAYNIDTVLLGRAVAPLQIGLYNRAFNIMRLPAEQVTSVISRVLLPALAEIQDDLPRLRGVWLRAVRVSVVLAVPVGLGVAVSAPAVVAVLYGPRWAGMVTVLTLLACAVPMLVLVRTAGPVFQALGRTGLEFRLALVTTAATVLAVLAGLPRGITGVATALLVNSVVTALVLLVPMARLIDLPLRLLWRTVRGSLVGGLLLVAAAGAVRWATQGWPALPVLLLQAVAGGAAYGAGLWWLERDLVAGPVRALLTRIRPTSAAASGAAPDRASGPTPIRAGGPRHAAPAPDRSAALRRDLAHALRRGPGRGGGPRPVDGGRHQRGGDRRGGDG